MDTGRVFLAWSIYLGAFAAHVLYWSLLPLGLSMRRAGMPVMASAEWLWVLAASQLALLAWPLLSASSLYGDGELHVFSTLGLWFGASAVAFVFSGLVLWLMDQSLPAEASNIEFRANFSLASAIAAIALTVACFAIAFTAAPRLNYF